MDGYLERAREPAGVPGALNARTEGGYVVIPLRYVAAAAVSALPIYLRQPGDRDHADTYTLYRGRSLAFTEHDRRRLLDNGVPLVYIPGDDEAEYRRRSADLTAAREAAAPLPEQAARLYASGLELVSELLRSPAPDQWLGRLRALGRGLAELVLAEENALTHLFAAAHHDYYLATHAMNVGTWMVALAGADGCHAPDELTAVCQAGLLHDIGRTLLPSEVWSRRGPFSRKDWAIIRRHPEAGACCLENWSAAGPLAVIVARQHHERLDGSGYPQGLRAERIHSVSRMCAIVDTFDALTAVRGYKTQALSVSEAILTLRAEAPTRFDARLVDTWVRLLDAVDDRELGLALGGAGADGERRRNQRFLSNTPALVRVLDLGSDARGPTLRFTATVHSASRFGLGLLSQVPICADARVRVYLHPEEDGALSVTGRTIRCRAYQDGWYEIGVELMPA